MDRVGASAPCTTSRSSSATSSTTTKFHFLSWEVLRGATLIGLVIVCVLVVITVLAAAFYNLFSELIGGLEVTVVEHEDAR